MITRRTVVQGLIAAGGTSLLGNFQTVAHDHHDVVDIMIADDKSLTSEGDDNGNRFMKLAWDLSRPIRVESHLGNLWDEAVRHTVSGWEKALPRLKTQLDLSPQGKCEQKIGAIVICRKNTPNAAGATRWNTEQHEIVASKITIAEPYFEGGLWREDVDIISVYDVNTLAHEFGHALGLNHNGPPETSCLGDGSLLTSPGPWDIKSLKRLYSGHTGKHAKKHGKEDRRKDRH